MKDMGGKVAVVTGASRGLGTFIAKALAREGAVVVGVARSRAGLEKTRADIEASGGRALSVPFDLQRTEDFGSLVEEIRAVAWPVDILVNNAGVEKYSNYQDFTYEDLCSILSVNLTAPLELSRRLLPDMVSRGDGHIVNIASLAGKKGSAYNSLYSASKAGLIMWTDAMRQELEGTGVRVSVICPGYVSGAGMFHDARLSAPALLSTSRAEEVADAVLRAVRFRRAEIIVNKGPMRPLLALGQIAPVFGDTLVRWLGVKKVCEERVKAAAGKSSDNVRAA